MNVNGRVYEKSSQSCPRNLKEPATIQPASSSTSHTNISSTTKNTIFSIACITTTSHTHLHTTDYLHHTNIKTSTTITTISITTLAPIIFPKQSRLSRTKNPVVPLPQLPQPPHNPLNPHLHHYSHTLHLPKTITS